MPAIVNIADFIKIGIFAFVFIWLANKALKQAGFSEYTTSGNA